VNNKYEKNKIVSLKTSTQSNGQHYRKDTPCVKKEIDTNINRCHTLDDTIIIHEISHKHDSNSNNNNDSNSPSLLCGSSIVASTDQSISSTNLDHLYSDSTNSNNNNNNIESCTIPDADQPPTS